MLPRPAHDRPLPADRRPLGAPQRLHGRRRPARARVVRHLAQARAHRHGPHADAAALLRPRQRPVRRDHHLSVHGRDADPPVLRRRRTLTAPRPRPARPAGPAEAFSGRCPRSAAPADCSRSVGVRALPGTSSDTLVWSPQGCPADGRSTSGRWVASRSRPSEAGLLAPCADDDQRDAGRAVDDQLHHRAVRRAPRPSPVRSPPPSTPAPPRPRPSSWPSSRTSPRAAPPTR